MRLLATLAFICVAGGCAHAPKTTAAPAIVLAPLPSIEAPQASIDSVMVATPPDTADIIRIPASFSDDLKICIEGIRGNDPACLSLNELRAIAGAKRLAH